MIISITNECSQFLRESKGQPLMKYLQKSSDGFRKVKVRKQKVKNELDTVFNETFTHVHQIRQRSIIANTKSSELIESDVLERFYIFPIDGYEFLYSETVKNSEEVYGDALTQISNQVGEDGSTNIMSELLEYNYTDVSLHTALEKQCEIIIYGIPYFYAIRESLVEDYDRLIYE